MNPGPVEEVGASARSAIDALKSTPVVLALVIFNVLYLGFGFWEALKMEESRKELLQTWAHEHERNAELLAKCIVPLPGMKLQSDDERSVPLPPLRPMPRE